MKYLGNIIISISSGWKFNLYSGKCHRREVALHKFWQVCINAHLSYVYIRHNLEATSRSSQQPLAFPGNVLCSWMLPSMEHSNPLYFVQLDDEHRLLSLHL